MSKFDSWVQQIQDGIKPFLNSMSYVANDVYKTIKQSALVKTMKDVVRSGKMKLEDAEKYIRDLEAKAKQDQPLQDERVIWSAMYQVIKEDFANYNDQFFEELAKLKDTPEISKIATQILEERQTQRPDVIFDAEVEAVFVKFTERAKRVITLAEKAARQMGHNFIAAPHIMIGIIKEGSGVGASVMRDNFKVDVQKLVSDTKLAMSDIEDAKPDQPVRLTKRAKAVLLMADVEATNLKSHRIGTEHLLLALTQEFSHASPLSSMGIAPHFIREHVMSLIVEKPTTDITADDVKAIADSIVRIDVSPDTFTYQYKLVVGKDKVLMANLDASEMAKLATMLKTEIALGITEHLKKKGML